MAEKSDANTHERLIAELRERIITRENGSAQSIIENWMKLVDRIEAEFKKFDERHGNAEALKAAKEMQLCPNGMCGHCIEVLCEELLPALGDCVHCPVRDGIQHHEPNCAHYRKRA